LICLDGFKAHERESTSRTPGSEPSADPRDGITGELNRFCRPYLPSLLADSERWWRVELGRTGYREA
jgi:hypothetical protein